MAPRRKASKEVETYAAASLNAISPTEAQIGGADITLTVTGVGFVDGDDIVFNGGEEPTTFVDGNTLTTVVKPSTASVTGVFPVLVRCTDGDTNSIDFTFTEAAAPVTPTTGAEVFEQLKSGDTSGLAGCPGEELATVRVDFKDWMRDEVARVKASYYLTYDALLAEMARKGVAY